MIDRSDLVKQLSVSAELQSIDELEEWLDSESWDVHKSGDQQLVDAVFHIESLLSAFEAERLPKAQLLEELREILRPFVEPQFQYEMAEEPLQMTVSFIPEQGIPQMSWEIHSGPVPLSCDVSR